MAAILALGRVIAIEIDASKGLFVCICDHSKGLFVCRCDQSNGLFVCSCDQCLQSKTSWDQGTSSKNINVQCLYCVENIINSSIISDMIPYCLVFCWLLCSRLFHATMQTPAYEIVILILCVGSVYCP